MMMEAAEWRYLDGNTLVPVGMMNIRAPLIGARYSTSPQFVGTYLPANNLRMFCVLLHIETTSMKFDSKNRTFKSMMWYQTD
jgi:hypothetical protein